MVAGAAFTAAGVKGDVSFRDTLYLGVHVGVMILELRCITLESR